MISALSPKKPYNLMYLTTICHKMNTIESWVTPVKLRYNLKHNLEYLIVGLTGALIGLILIHDRTYFFWPPKFLPYFNSYAVGVIGGISGLGLIIYGLLDKHNDYVVGLLLAVSAGFVSILIFAELLPVVGIGYFHWHIGIVLLTFYLIEIMKVAYLRKPSQRN